MLGQLFVQLVFKIFNLFGPDPSTSQADGQTDDMQLQDRVLHYSASCSKKSESKLHYNCIHKTTHARAVDGK